METVEKYVAHLDHKKRVTLRGAAYEYYEVTEYDSGCILLVPRVLAVPEGISPETLACMDKCMENYKKGITFEPIDFSKYNL
ncbi:MAG: hypothetical protein LUD51_07760 [Clostridia bacterium]|nr:hypothetical protein [Clostridia bacterium]